MSIDQMLKRFGPVFATDGEGAGGAAAEVAAAIANVAEAEPAEEEVYELPEDIDAGAAVEPEYEEYDLDGVKVKAPKDQIQALKDAAYRQADYTRKTQAAAEKERLADAREAAATERMAQDEQFREGEYILKQLDFRLGEAEKYFNSPEFKQLSIDDPLLAQSQENAFNRDERKRAKLVGALGQLQQERNSKAAEEARQHAETTSRLREQALQKTAKDIPGWNADRQAKVRTAAVARGYAPEAIDSITDPLHWADLYYADIGRQAVAARARSGSGAARVQAAPGTTRTVGQGGAALGTGVAKLDKASPDDYVAMRRKQMGAK